MFRKTAVTTNFPGTSCIYEAKTAAETALEVLLFEKDDQDDRKNIKLTNYGKFNLIYVEKG